MSKAYSTAKRSSAASSPAAASAKPDHRADAWARLESGLAAITTGEDWRAYLSVQARFHNYSFGNVLLILSQCPAASRVAGFSTWTSLGRYVRKGESALWIFAPSVRKPKAANADGSDTDAAPEDLGSSTSTIAYFITVPVFDVSQTDGEPLPELPRLEWRSQAGEDSAASSALYSSLSAFGTGLGWDIKREPGASIEALGHAGALGLCCYSKRSILLLDTLTGAEVCRTLAHELAHALCDGQAGDRLAIEDRELRAESVAFLVLEYFGLSEGDESSFNYVATWQARHGKDASARLRELGRSVQQTAARIIDAVVEPATLAVLS